MAWYRTGGGGSVTPQGGIPFICSDGKQYFALPNIYGDDDYRYEFKLIVPSEQQSLIFGGNWNVGSKLLHTYGSNMTYYMTNSPTQISYTCWDIMDIDASTTYIKVNGTSYTSTAQARGHELIYLFGFSNGYKSSIGISEFKIYDNSDDSLVMDLVPMKNSSTGAGYFHDTVGDNDYYSESGYDFEYVAFDGGSNLITKQVISNGTYSATQDDVDGYSTVNVKVPVVTNFTNVVTQGVLSADSQYKSATFDVDISNYKYILIKTYEQGGTIDTKNCTWIALDGTFPKYLSLCFVADYNRYLSATLTATSLTTTYYSGSWSTIYVDIIGTTGDIFDDTSYITDQIPIAATSESTEPFSNSDYAPQLACWQAFDKDQTTMWASANGNGDKYIGWKFATAVPINKVSMQIGSNSGWEIHQAPNTWFVEGSNDDGTTWTVVNYNEHSWTTAYEEIEYEFLNETAYKWWRIRITRTTDGTSGCASLAELDFYYVNRSNSFATKSITTNGTYNAIDDGVDGYSEVTVNVISYKNYIKFNGEGIMLPWSINSDYKIEVTFHETTYSNDSAIIGNSIGPSDMHLTEYNNKYYFLQSRNGETNYGTWSAGEHTFIYNNGEGKNTLDGTVVSNFTPYNYSSALYSIGCRGGITSNVYNGWIKSYKIYSISQDELIHDLRPATVAGYPCFIDVIGNAIYSNSSIQAVDTIT